MNLTTLLLPIILAGQSTMPSATPKAARSGWIWLEAESASRTNFPPPERNPFAPASPQEAAVLSGGRWVGAEGQRPVLFLEFDLVAPEAGRYNLFARKFWKHGPFRFRVGSGPWASVGETALLDDAPIRQFVVANWVHAGEVSLAAGPNTLRVELTSQSGAASFDAFVLTRGGFTPRGKLKPGEKYGTAPAGWFAFEPDPDPFAASAALDLRSLNEGQAGENGFIAARGEDLVHSKTGKVVRFWAVNTSTEALSQDPGSINAMARSLAKAGVNLIRVHGGLWGPDFRKVDAGQVAKLHTFVAAMKREGIYTSLSIYFPLWLRFDENSGFAGYSGGNHPFSLLYFNAEFQKIYRGWWRDVLTPKNSHTGLSLAEDPAVAMVEMVNEDSHLFWTFTPYQNVPAPQMEELERQFGRWLAGRYGSLAAAFSAWGGAPVRGDDAAAGRAGFMPLYEVFSKRDRRAQDSARFLTLNMREFYEGTQKFLKADLGFKGLTTASNWTTAEPRILGPLEKWSNSVADVMDRHGYWGPAHEGERASYSISAGDRYEDGSALHFSGGFSLPLWDIRYDRKPSMISEINWTPPNRFRADLPLLAAAYGLLQGTDSFVFFATGKASWEETIGKFALRTPVLFAQFPGAALIYRLGLVKPGPVVAEANLRLDDLFALKGAPLSQPQNLDELRQKDVPPGRSGTVASLDTIDPLAFAVGRVAINFVATAVPSTVADITGSIDRQSKVVTSATGELRWDWGRGRMSVTAPAAQGVTGFLKAGGPFQTPDLRIESDLEYGSILVVAMDGQPIRTSRKILLQVMSEEQPFGWQAPGSGKRAITNVGGPPVVVKHLSGQVSLLRTDAPNMKVTPLDANGYRLPATVGATSIRLAPNVLHYVIEPS